MKRLFDYFFYRVYRFYEIQEWGDPETSAYLLLSLFQYFFILSVYALGSFLINFSYRFGKYEMVIPGVLLAVLNWYIYEKKLRINVLKERWNGEDIDKRKTRGLAIVVLMFVLVATLSLIGIISPLK